MAVPPVVRSSLMATFLSARHATRPARVAEPGELTRRALVAGKVSVVEIGDTVLRDVGCTRDIYDLLEAVVGDAFPRLFAFLKRERVDEYMIGALVNDIRVHFNAQVGTGSNTVPGKSRT